jgi:hypothetical protein
VETPSHCLNCGTALQGPHCHACGQPVKGMVRHLKSILQDFLDTIFEYDSRIWRTLVPLYLRPGHITNDFLAGKRIRYVLPFRLMFVLTVVTFLALQLLMDPIAPQDSASRSMHQADTVAEVEALRDEALAELAQAREALDEGFGRAGAQAGMRAAEQAVEREAQQRIDWLESAAAARAEGRSPPAPRARIIFGDEAWDLETNPLEIAWLPEPANRRINLWIDRAAVNLQKAGEEPDQLVDSFLGLLPAALFVLMPLFALLVMLMHWRRHWLYTAHLVVALHSHSFLALALLVVAVLSALERLAAGVVWAAQPLAMLGLTAQLWIPVYLLIMQRRVYGDRWLVTLFKYSVIGVVYLILLTVVVMGALLISLVVA